MNPLERPVPLDNLINLSEKSAIVTGGASGIGYAICYRLAEAGARVFIADTSIEEGQQTCRELKGYGYRVDFVRCDISKEEDVREMVEGVASSAGGIDILVNNAGIFPRRPLSEVTCEDFERVMSINLKGTFLCSREVSSRMIERDRGGCIINMASVDAVRPSSSGLTAYDASKGGVLMLTRSMALELGQHDIRVNAIAPGGILTAGVVSSLKKSSAPQGKAELKAFLARMPLGRMGAADDVARVALFLASDLASYITGSMVVVDGGFLVS